MGKCAGWRDPAPHTARPGNRTVATPDWRVNTVEARQAFTPLATDMPLVVWESTHLTQHHELENPVRKSFLLKALLAAAFPLFATEDETASAAPSSTDAAQEQPTSDGAAPTGDAIPVVQVETPVTSAGPSDEPPVAAAPVVQTPTPVAQSGDAGDPVLDTVKTPAHNVAAEIQEAIQKIEQLPAEVAAWFEAKFSELSTHIKALL